MYRLLVINPGSTSTKLALFEDERRVVQETVEHDPAELRRYDRLRDQLPERLTLIQAFLEKHQIAGDSLDAVVGRGGLVYGLETGGYLVNDALCHALVTPGLSETHASNLGGLLAREVAEQFHIPAYIYDAVTSGELSPVAQITGIPDIRRKSFCHVLNSRAMAHRYAQEHAIRYEDLRLIVVHLGGGVSASVHEYGAITDSVGDDDGQFSPERSGSLPSLEIVRLCYSGKYTQEEMRKKIRGKGGMYAYLGTCDCRVIEKRIAEGDEFADLILQAQAYQIAKTIGLLSIVLKGDCDAIILTGGMAHSSVLTGRIREYVQFIAPVCVMPGENEMEALAQGGLRLLTGQEVARTYHLPAEPEKEDKE